MNSWTPNCNTDIQLKVVTFFVTDPYNTWTGQQTLNHFSKNKTANVDKKKKTKL